MSVPAAANPETIDDKAQLVDYLAAGCKPRRDWRIGTEHEKFAFRKSDRSALAYDGEDGIRAILTGLMQFGWDGVYEGETLVGLRKAGASVSLEPGGQIELSGAPLETIHQTCDEVHTHLDEMQKVVEPLGVGLLGMGMTPNWRREDVNWMPKGRYKIMREYMPKRGSLGLDMMIRTCTVQVNLDFESEADMVKKFRVALALQPVATALFAKSPFTEGKPNGYLSYRSHIWTDTDPDRTGMLPFVFDGAMGFERWVDYVLDVPMYFVYRDGAYIDTSGQSFRDFMDGRLPALPGERPTMGDWGDHMTTIFPEVRLKTFLEMRGADGGRWQSLCALPALWVGLLYDDTALDAAWDLVRDWTVEEQLALRDQAPMRALKTEFRGGTVQEIALEVLEIAKAGLKARNILDRGGQDETAFLNRLWEIARAGVTPAEELLAAYNGRWQGRVDPVFEDYAF